MAGTAVQLLENFSINGINSLAVRQQFLFNRHDVPLAKVGGKQGAWRVTPNKPAF
jgi:hypothetical protein